MRTPALAAMLVFTGLLSLACGNTPPSAPPPVVLTVPEAPPENDLDELLDIAAEEEAAMDAAILLEAASANPGPFSDPGGSGPLCCGESVGGDMFYADPKGGSCDAGLSWHRGKEPCSTVCCEFKNSSTSYATTLRGNCVDTIGGSAKLAVALKCKGKTGSTSSRNRPSAGASTNLNRGGGSGGNTKVRGGSSSGGSGSGTTLRR